MAQLAVSAQPSIVNFVKTLYSRASFRDPLLGKRQGKSITMLGNIQSLFIPADKQAWERMAVLERDLDGIAKDASARFCRGNAAAQLGLLESAEELDAKRDLTIARRA